MQNAPQGPHEDSHDSAHGKFDSAHSIFHMSYFHMFCFLPTCPHTGTSGGSAVDFAYYYESSTLKQEAEAKLANAGITTPGSAPKIVFKDQPILV